MPRSRSWAFASPLDALVLLNTAVRASASLQCRDSSDWCWQGEELEPARKKAEAAGVKEIFIDDVREEFVREYVFPMFRCAEPNIERRVLFTTLGPAAPCPPLCCKRAEPIING